MKSEIVFETQHKYIDFDTTIIPGVITSCVLAVVFFTNIKKVLAYHWFGFILDPDGRQAYALRDMCNLDENTVSKILVLGNHFTDTIEQGRRIKNMQILQWVFDGVETHYYVNQPDNENISISITSIGAHTGLDEMTEVTF